jgi:hypothetical protein
LEYPITADILSGVSSGSLQQEAAGSSPTEMSDSLPQHGVGLVPEAMPPAFATLLYLSRTASRIFSLSPVCIFPPCHYLKIPTIRQLSNILDKKTPCPLSRKKVSQGRYGFRINPTLDFLPPSLHADESGSAQLLYMM